MDKATILATLDFSRARLLGVLTTIESSGQDVQKVIAWRPATGRAHIAWQALHCAATHDRYANVRLKGGTETDPALVAAYGGGSTPSDANIPTLASIKETLAKHYSEFTAFIKELSADELAKVTEFPGGIKRTTAESLILLGWHEAHHQGQIHLTWNLYKAAHGIKV